MFQKDGPVTKGQEADSDSAIVKVVGSISDLEKSSWDACAMPDAEHSNPFVSHTFLDLLERAGTVGAEAGWLPQHLALIDEKTDTMTACMPCYLKSHSQGEYVFDYAFADALERAGGNYYPKLQCAVPFTPVPGPRFLTGHGDRKEHKEKLLAAAALELAKRHKSSSFHATFVDHAAWNRLGRLGFLQRIDQQFHFSNQGYESFDDFLSTLTSRKRKAVRKERATAICNEITISHLRGDEITEAHWDRFFKFYINTGLRKWGQPYLNRKFFSLLSQEMSDACLLILAERDGLAVAGALNIIGNNCLYGRYWGALEHHPCLHFEVCYYQAIDYAIANGLARVEAGAQGEHKLARGYLPTTTYSLHWFAEPSLHKAVEDYLKHERRQVTMTNEVLTDYAPFRNVTSNPSKK